MSGVAAYGASIMKSGTSTSFTTEACTKQSGNTWRINDTTKRVWNRDASFSFFDNGSPISGGDILSIDYLFGEVTFTGSKTGPITVTGEYLPMTEIAGAKEFNLMRTSAILDDTSTGNLGYHTKVYGLQDASISCSRWTDLTQTFADILANRTSVVISITPGSAYSARGWFVVESANLNLDVNSLLEESISFQLDGDSVAGKTFSAKIVS